MKEQFSDFTWHSALGIDDVINSKKRFVASLSVDDERVSRLFFAHGKQFMIHKATNALWKKTSENTIEPVFGSDVLTNEDLETLSGDKNG